MPIQEMKKIVFTCDACGNVASGWPGDLNGVDSRSVQETIFRGNIRELAFPAGWVPVHKATINAQMVACSPACAEKLTAPAGTPEYFIIRTKGQGEHKASECPALGECEQTITCCRCGKQSCRGCAPIPENFIFCHECFDKEHK